MEAEPLSFIEVFLMVIFSHEVAVEDKREEVRGAPSIRE